MNDPLLSKAEIRTLTLRRRNALSSELRQQHSSAILSRILALDAYREARTVAAYCSFGSEVETAPLLTKILAQGKNLLLPKVNRGKSVLDLYVVTNIQTDLCCGVWGIFEPTDHCVAVEPCSRVDLVLVPGIAFDRKGNRIGYGKGYYDKLLNSLRQANQTPVTVAPAFEIQLWETLPVDAYDVAVESVITEASSN